LTQHPLWIDERLYTLPPRPWRKVHLDFHNSQHIPNIGAAFDADEFGDRLLQAHVDSIVVFAKDMHGYFYYPSEYGPVHPGLAFDLLGRQVEACQRRNIKVYAYYCVTWDNYLAERHPEWLVFKRDRSTYLPRFDEPPHWTALCLSHNDFVELVLNHSRECLTRYDLDGIWYDMPLPIDGECFCTVCLSWLRAAGLDPFDVAAQRAHKQQLLVDFMRRAHTLAHELRPGIQVDQNNQTRLGLGARAAYLDNIDIEALPTAFWGYLYFPTNVRYARTCGVSVYGMTGRFQRSWADFGGLKHPNQLRAELAGIIAQGAHCDIGDQMPPAGRLDPAVYDTIGRCYAEIAHLEPYLDRAAPVVEAAIVVRGLPLDDFGHAEQRMNVLGSSVLGIVKLLMEAHVQFDIIDADDPSTDARGGLDRYRLLVLPDALPVDTALGAVLRAFLSDGGAIIASHDALRIAGAEAIWADQLSLTYHGESPFAPAYLKLGPALRAELPDYEFALYDGAAQWLLDRDHTAVLAHLGEPRFQRSAARYTSHAQTPFDHGTSYAAVVQQGRLAAIAFPIGASYYRHGYWIYREIFCRLVRGVLPVQLVETNAPISAEIAVTHQRGGADHPERWMIHVVNVSPNRRTPEHCEYLEDPIPLRDVWIRLAIDTPIAGAYSAADGSALPLRAVDDGWRVEIPRVDVGVIAVLECARP
jgi:hypothetical protein